MPKVYCLLILLSMKISLFILFNLVCSYSFAQDSSLEAVREAFQKNKHKMTMSVLKKISKQDIINKRVPESLKKPLAKELQDLDSALTELEKAAIK